MKNLIKTMCLCLAAVALTVQISCITTPVGITSSVSPVHDKKIEKNLGKTQGSDSAFSVLNLWMIGRPDINDAIKEAVQKKGGDTLINVRTYEKFTSYLLFSTTTVIVEGEAVKLSGDRK